MLSCNSSEVENTVVSHVVKLFMYEVATFSFKLQGAWSLNPMKIN